MEFKISEDDRVGKSLSFSLGITEARKNELFKKLWIVIKSIEELSGYLVVHNDKVKKGIGMAECMQMIANECDTIQEFAMLYHVFCVKMVEGGAFPS